MKRGIVTAGFSLVFMAACGGTDVAGSRIKAGSGSASSTTAPGATASPGSGPATSASNPKSGLISGSAGSGSVPAPTTLKDGECASASVAATRITPTVYLVLDGSGSMNAQFGDGTRWSVLRESLVGSAGVVTQLESIVEFGMSVYSSLDPMSCPTTSDVKPALSNLMPLSAALPAAEPGGGTPTGEALQKVVDGLPDYNGLDQTGSAPIIILATDGEPNGCDNPGNCNWADWAMCLGKLADQLANAAPTYDSTFKAVRAAHAKNIPVWVVSLADGLNAVPQLQTVANIGAGLEDNASPGAMIYSPTNPAELTQTLTKLIGAVVSCEVTLAGSLNVDRACEGSVMMNGERLACNDAQGWKAVDGKHIALQGAACEQFKSNPAVRLDASFPCDVVVLQ